MVKNMNKSTLELTPYLIIRPHYFKTLYYVLHKYIHKYHIYLKITSGAIYSGVPNTCLSENCRVSLSTCTSYKLVATITIKKLQLLLIINYY